MSLFLIDIIDILWYFMVTFWTFTRGNLMLIIGFLVFMFTLTLCLIGVALALGIKTTTGSTQDIVEFLGSAPTRRKRTISDYRAKLGNPDLPNNQIRPPTDSRLYLGAKICEGLYFTVPGLHKVVARINVTPQILQFAQPDNELIDILDGAVRITLRAGFQVINTERAYYNISVIDEDDNPGDIGYRDELQSLLDSVLRTVIKRHYVDAELDVIRLNMEDISQHMLAVLNTPLEDSPLTKLETIGLAITSLDITDVQPSDDALKAIEQKFIARQQAAIRKIEATGLVDAAQELASAQGISPEEATQQIMTIQRLETIKQTGTTLNVTTIGDDIFGALRALSGNIGG